MPVFGRRNDPVRCLTFSWRVTTMWVNRPLEISQLGQLSLSSFRGRQVSSELQLDVRHLNRWRRHLVNAYEVKARMVFIAGISVWSMPECFKVVCVYHTRRYTSALLYLSTFTFILPYLINSSTRPCYHTYIVC